MKLNLRVLFWIVFFASVAWEFVDFAHELSKAFEQVGKQYAYPTPWSAFSLLIGSLISNFQWIFYAEAYHLLKQILAKKEKE